MDPLEDTWEIKILKYLRDNELPRKDEEAERVAWQVKRYTLVDGALFRWGNNEVLLKCISREEGMAILQEIHGGECGNHAASRALAGKTF